MSYGYWGSDVDRKYQDKLLNEHRKWIGKTLVGFLVISKSSLCETERTKLVGTVEDVGAGSVKIEGEWYAIGREPHMIHVHEVL
jgi:hypothetical protein